MRETRHASSGGRAEQVRALTDAYQRGEAVPPQGLNLQVPCQGREVGELIQIKLLLGKPVAVEELGAEEKGRLSGPRSGWDQQAGRRSLSAEGRRAPGGRARQRGAPCLTVSTRHCRRQCQRAVPAPATRPRARYGGP